MFAGKRILFVTNNASKSRSNYKKKFDGLGIENGERPASITSCQNSFNNHIIIDNNAHLIFSDQQDPADNTLSAPGEIPPDPSVGAVLIGLDTSINYTKMSRAFRYLHSNPDCFFLATNEDSTFPTESGLLPGSGALLATLVTALGPNRPVTSIGKPSGLMLDAVKAKYVPVKQTSLCVVCYFAHAAFRRVYGPGIFPADRSFWVLICL